MRTDRLKEALSSAEITDVRYTELSGEAFETDDEEFIAEAKKQAVEAMATVTEGDSDFDRDQTPNEYQSWRLMLSGGEGMLEVGLRLNTRTARSRLTVEAIAHYHLDYDLDELRDPDTRDAVLAHAQQSSYLDIVPYIREAAEDLSRRLRINPPYVSYKFSKAIEGARLLDSPEE